MPVIDLEKMKMKQMTFRGKVIDFSQRAKQKVKNGVEWCKENPREAVTLLGGAAAVLTGANKVVRGVNRHLTARKERYTKERFVYDRSLNLYVKTKRKLTAKDLDHINTVRRQTGKKVSEVLSDMNLIQK